MIDIEAFLAETAEQPPCGPNLEYDPAFIALGTLAQRKAEQQFGNTVIPAEEPDWRRVDEAAQELLQRSKDLRIAILQMRAWTNLEGLAGFNAGLALLTGLIERYWDNLLPPLDADEDNDPLFRLNTLAPLSDPDMLLGDLRAAPILTSRAAGPLSLRDLELHQGRLAPRDGETPLGETQLRGMIEAAVQETPDALAPAARMLPAIRELSNALTQHVGERAPDLSPLLAAAQLIGPLASSHHDTNDEAPTVQAAAEQNTAAAATTVAGRPTGISSRQDVRAVLDMACEFLERTEPSNPAPLLLRRAQAMLDKDFITIMRELTPDGLRQAEIIAGTQPP